jgi:hypothetical protein
VRLADGRDALVDRSGRTIWTAAAGDRLGVESEGLIEVERQKKLGFLDAATGLEVIAPTWDSPGDQLEIMTGRLAMVAMKKDGVLWRGYIDRTGTVIRPLASALWRPAPR